MTGDFAGISARYQSGGHEHNSKSKSKFIYSIEAFKRVLVNAKYGNHFLQLQIILFKKL